MRCPRVAVNHRWDLSCRPKPRTATLRAPTRHCQSPLKLVRQLRRLRPQRSRRTPPHWHSERIRTATSPRSLSALSLGGSAPTAWSTPRTGNRARRNPGHSGKCPFLHIGRRIDQRHPRASAMHRQSADYRADDRNRSPALYPVQMQHLVCVSRREMHSRQCRRVDIVWECVRQSATVCPARAPTRVGMPKRSTNHIGPVLAPSQRAAGVKPTDKRSEPVFRHGARGR